MAVGGVRVVVTGLGAITALGGSAADLWQGAREGRVAIGPVGKFPMDQYQTRLGGALAVQPRPEHDYPRPEGHREPVFDYILQAAEEALGNCGIDFQAVPPDRWGVVAATCTGGIVTGEKWYAEVLDGGEPDPRLLPLFPGQGMAEVVSSAFGMTGPVLSLNTACAAGANTIGLAADLIRLGHADVMVAAAAEALSTVLFAGFSSMEALSDEPAAPYSKTRKGLSIGEGAGALVLVRADIAARLGVPALAEIAGYGLSADGYHPTAPHPDGEGGGRAIAAALSAAGVAAGQVGYINGHGTGTPLNDSAETAGIKRALGAAAAQVPVSSTKSVIGHLMGAAGLVEAIVTIGALREQVAPPTAGLIEADPECDLDLPRSARAISTDVALSNNFAFGGANACLVLARPGAIATPTEPKADRVVVTGLSALTSLGAGVEAAAVAVERGTPALALEDGVHLGRVDVDLSTWLSPREMRRMDRAGVLAVISARLALEDSGIQIDAANRGRIGVLCGTYLGAVESVEAFLRAMLEEGPQAVSPAIFPNTVWNAAAGQVAIHLGAVGPTSTVTSGHAAGAQALAYAFDLVARDAASAMLVVGVDTLPAALVRGYRDLGLLDGERGLAGLAEGAGGLLLERLASASARGATVQGELLGYGMAADARGVGRVDPEGRGVERAMRAALANAGIAAADVATTWSAMGGSAAADGAEAAAIQRVFGSGARVCSPKLVLGDALGASGALAAVLAAAGWSRGAARAPVIVNSASLGGTHISLVLAPPS